MRGSLSVFFFSLLVAGCGSSAPERPAESSADHREEEAQSASVSGSIPKRCARGKNRKECVPPPGWVRRLCEDVYPDVALHMFRPGTPWKRLYMLARAEPFNASGGASLLGDKLERGEEVIALKRRSNEGEFQVGDNAGYDVLRWNGACATIHDGDYSEEPPGRVVHSKVEWRRLSPSVRQALEAEPRIAAAYEARRKSCKGQSVGVVSDHCEESDQSLIDEVVRYVQSGAKLPPAERMP